MSLSGYGLIAIGGKKSMLAAFRYLLIGTIGASLYLLGVGYMYALTGTLNMADMAVRAAEFLHYPLFALAVACFVIGFGIKMALFPLHGWQPDAYNYAHPGSAAFIAGCMSKVPAYAMIRFLFYMFGVDNPVVKAALDVIGILGIAGILLGSFMALAQYDFRRMLAYSSVAQIGYIAIGLAMGNLYGFIGAVLHIINHAFMKSALFFVIGGIQYRFGEVNIYRLGGMNKKVAISSITVTLAALSMIGIPPTGGFFSKWYLLLGAYTGEQYVYIGVLVISSLLNAIYFFRILEQMFVQREASLTEVHRHKGKLGLPFPMAVPIAVTGIGIVALGFYSVDIVTEIIKLGLPEVLLK
jgi:multicomponent Na+:H+ antiporter subunit D